MRTFNIEAPDEALRGDIRQKINNLNKPKGSLGRLETLAEQLCLIQQTLSPELRHPCHLLFGGDHGIEREGVSISPREVTWQQMINFTRGGGGVNMFCRQHGFTLYIIDVGVDHDLSNTPDIINRKVAYGTKNFLYEPAMTDEQFSQAVETGCEMVELCHSNGCNIVCLGEMGIGNTSPSSVWMHLLGDVPLNECIGAGSGLNAPGLYHKHDVLTAAVEHFRKASHGLRLNEQDTTLWVIRYFAGFEMAAAIGAMMRAAELKMAIMVDGFIMTACMLAASTLNRHILNYAVFGHCGDENGHRRMLQLMNAEPLLQLGLRLGEGTGALCAYPIIESAVRMVNEMNNFDDAKITKYF